MGFPATCFLFLVLTVVPARAQESGGLTTRNPLDEIRDELIRVLSEAGVPFGPDQEISIALVLEESRRASEQLFGDVMNFGGGPPQGESLDRALAGIEWMNEDFRQRVRDDLSPEQLEVWDAYLLDRADERETTSQTAGTSQQVQQIRINNNPFTAENQSGGSYGFSSGSGVQAQIIQRGGTGRWHGNSQFQFRDEALNARNPFASNKPPYQQRSIDLGINGPLIPGRLTISSGLGDSKSDSAFTVNAETPDGPVERGFTRPQSSRNGYVSGIYQLADNQSAHFNAYVSRSSYENQGVGGTNLPERAIDYYLTNENFSVRHVWFHSDRLVQDISFNTSGNTQESIPRMPGGSVNVLGSFSGGGGQNRGLSRSRDYELDALWILTEDVVTVRTGGRLYRTSVDSTSESNFLGTFTFPNLDAFQAGQPTLYTETRGDPSLINTQTEWSAFAQNEHRLSSRLTLFYGLRYQRQTNLADHNNFDPRIGFAYALGSASVVRAGAGVFHVPVSMSVESELIRLDGTRQYEIVISDPSYPDPYQSGDLRLVPPSSRRVRGGDLVAPYEIDTSVQFERSLPANLFVTASFDYRRGYHLLRSRNLNAPLPGETERPDPSEGNVWLLESTGVSTFRALRVAMRQRLSIFNVNASYTYEADGTDSLGTFGAPANNYDLRADWASVGRHQFSTTVNSQLPLDVYLRTNISFGSGNPYTITTGFDENRDGVFNDRPPGVTRNTARGPYQHNVSFNISKAFPLGDTSAGGANLNLYANMNNAFNRVNLGTPISNLSSSRFGQFVSASNPREITVGMRFSF